MSTKEKNILNGWKTIKAGRVISCNGVKIWIAYSCNGNRDFIFWQSYGGSAERVSFNNFRWILDVIAQSKDYSFEVVAA